MLDVRLCPASPSVTTGLVIPRPEVVIATTKSQLQYPYRIHCVHSFLVNALRHTFVELLLRQAKNPLVRIVVYASHTVTEIASTLVLTNFSLRNTTALTLIRIHFHCGCGNTKTTVLN